MNNNQIAPHESFGLHGLLTFESLSAAKAAAMSPLVRDPEIKALLGQALTDAHNHIRELQTLMQASPFAARMQ